MYILRLSGNKFDDGKTGKDLADSVSQMTALKTLRYVENISRICSL